VGRPLKKIKFKCHSHILNYYSSLSQSITFINKATLYFIDLLYSHISGEIHT